MLDAPEAFLFGGGYDFTIAEQTSCRVAMVGVDPEDKQKATLLAEVQILSKAGCWPTRWKQMS